jgi:hypothetical protein
MISANTIMAELDVTEQQVVMAIYSGRIPKPTHIDGTWSDLHIEPFLTQWKKTLRSKRDEISSTISSGNMEFPKHQR